MVKQILIVEDEHDMQNLMKIYIERSGLNVQLHHAYTGEDGIEMYQQLLEDDNRPALVIMDFKLPGIDGVETTRRIKQLDSEAVIYGFTAFFETRWSQKLKEAGATDVIPRPIGFDGFVEHIRNILET
jgi:DNA-binding response OmpR family regulator